MEPPNSFPWLDTLLRFLPDILSVPLIFNRRWRREFEELLKDIGDGKITAANPGRIEVFATRFQGWRRRHKTVRDRLDEYRFSPSYGSRAGTRSFDAVVNLIAAIGEAVGDKRTRLDYELIFRGAQKARKPSRSRSRPAGKSASKGRAKPKA